MKLQERRKQHTINTALRAAQSEDPLAYKDQPQAPRRRDAQAEHNALIDETLRQMRSTGWLPESRAKVTHEQFQQAMGSVMEAVQKARAVSMECEGGSHGTAGKAGPMVKRLDEIAKMCESCDGDEDDMDEAKGFTGAALDQQIDKAYKVVVKRPVPKAVEKRIRQAMKDAYVAAKDDLEALGALYSAARAELANNMDADDMDGMGPANEAKAPAKLKGKALDAALNRAYAVAGDNVQVNIMDLGKINKMMRDAYDAEADPETAMAAMQAAAKDAIAKFRKN